MIFSKALCTGLLLSSLGEVQASDPQPQTSLKDLPSEIIKIINSKGGGALKPINREFSEMIDLPHITFGNQGEVHRFTSTFKDPLLKVRSISFSTYSFHDNEMVLMKEKSVPEEDFNKLVTLFPNLEIIENLWVFPPLTFKT